MQIRRNDEAYQVVGDREFNLTRSVESKVFRLER